MTAKSYSGPKLADEESAFDSYLDALLGTGSTEEPDEQAELDLLLSQMHGSRPMSLRSLLEDDETAEFVPFDDIDIETVAGPDEARLITTAVSASAAAPLPEPATTTATRPTQPEAVVQPQSVPAAPVRSVAGPVPCLVLKRGSNAVAVRVQDIDVVVEWGGQVVGPGHGPEGHCGNLPYAGKQATIVDLGCGIFAVGAAGQALAAPSYAGTRLVIVGAGRIAFICDEIGEMLSVRPEEVEWAEQTTSTPWIDGVLKRSQSMLLNMNALASVYCEPQS